MTINHREIFNHIGNIENIGIHASKDLVNEYFLVKSYNHIGNIGNIEMQETYQVNTYVFYMPYVV